jgi:hypothetical protein
MSEFMVEATQNSRVFLCNMQADRRKDVIRYAGYDKEAESKLRLCELLEWEVFTDGLVISLATASQIFWEPSINMTSRDRALGTWSSRYNQPFIWRVNDYRG